MKVTPETAIQDFVKKYPQLKLPIESLKEVGVGYQIPVRIHISVKRMDELLFHYTGNPTSRFAWIPGDGLNEGLDGTEEARLYAVSPEWSRPDHAVSHEWFPEDEHREKLRKVGNIIFLIEEDRSFRPTKLDYVVLEVCNRWFTPRKTLFSVTGRSVLKAIEARFVIFLPPKDESLKEIFGRAFNLRKEFTPERAAEVRYKVFG